MNVKPGKISFSDEGSLDTLCGKAYNYGYGSYWKGDGGMRETHTFAPVFDRTSEILVLGSFPSVKSREQGFYYGHPRNRFWIVLAAVFGGEPPQSIAEKTAFLHRNKIALWDVIESCEITGSSDASIKNAVGNDLDVILSAAPIRSLFANGKTAGDLYRRLLLPRFGREITVLPSTSPANAAFSSARLIEAWALLKE